MVINFESTRVREEMKREYEGPFKVPQKLRSRSNFDISPHGQSESNSTIDGIQGNTRSGEEVFGLKKWVLQHVTDLSGNNSGFRQLKYLNEEVIPECSAIASM